VPASRGGDRAAEPAIGLDTFRPITAATAEEHVIHSERYSIPPRHGGLCPGRRVVAVGTTAVRALESAAATGARSGRTELYIHGSTRSGWSTY